jgi:indolepyruvate ferredoxin oxidoreductase
VTTTAPRVAPPDQDAPLLRESGRVVLGGNELIVKGALEAGVSLITGYPGSPVAEVFLVCEQHADHLAELGVEAILANNEAQSAAMLNGARQVPGARSMTVFKSVGAYVALDGLAIANAAAAAADAAAVVVVGDDPLNSSTQVGADSRVTMSAGRIPVIEPASFQEVKDFVRLAFDLSARSGLVVAVMVTTPQADGTAVVDVAPNRAPAVGSLHPATIDTRAIRVEDAVSLPPYTTTLEDDLLHRRIPALHAAAAAAGLSRVEGPVGRRHAFGFVTAGAAYALLRESLHALGLDDEVPVLRLGLTWPIDPEPVRAFAEGVDQIVVFEERAPHLEGQVRTALEGRGRPVWGKAFPSGQGVPDGQGLELDTALAALARLVAGSPGAFPAAPVEQAREALAVRERPKVKARGTLPLAQRTPTFCAGCPHRGTSNPMSEIRARLRDPEYMRRVHGREPVDVIAHGGIGCYSMNYLPPFSEMHNLSAMGLGGATGAGAAPLVTNKHYTLVGDGTFFHGEMSTIANAIKQDQDILYVILDNKNTAMTGHQGTPASSTDLMGRPQRPLEIEAIVRAMAPRFFARANPDDRDAYMELLERAMLMDGTRIVIADKECAITSGRRLRRERQAVVRERGFLPEVTRYNIVEEACENCRACTTGTGCPGLAVVDTPLGEKIGIDGEVCVDDGYCARIKACPSFELVTVHRSKAPAAPAAADGAAPLDPVLPSVGPEGYAVYMAGVGGMGIGVASRILTEAAAAAFPEVDTYHKKGLAQRGGGVFCDMVMHDGHRIRSPLIADGGADLVLGLEAIEGLRAMQKASPERTAAVVNTAARPTTTILMGADRAPDALVDRARQSVRPDGLLAVDFASACEEALGDRIYANVALLGAAFQQGWLPIPREAFEAAIRSVAGRRAEANLQAFTLGRRLAAEGLAPAPAPEALDDLVAREGGWIRKRAERRAYEAAMARAAAIGLDEEVRRMLAVRAPEVIAWGGTGYLERYMDLVERVAAARPGLAGHAVHNLHRTMCIKDEVFVAHLLTSERKYARDRERFGVDRSRGDRISYVHLNRPAVDVLGRHIEFDMKARDWMLKLARRARFSRRLLPAWHRRERAFREWYEREVLPAVVEGRLSGPAAEEAIRLPERVTGYREIRYPKDEAARARFRELTGAAA